ncbi:3'(2'),5'-bisphosphate nucleotidase CysQ [Shewanella yunxiaonensis]|uniref:3'(2'),5'-bisphosphate nucleotidase CysQ n=1 Tax=Shewanella yunxiaonensis TaxID=2829809 RepID=A0ABX7YW69_9GAMM|nr:3'(2'),5'-bisphosphate nucleotidase CysQ [Shewanella yunxiaonensis]QUN06957.1 3'(2'),5'-bisphosphate nucleotidase CysQ [Shewanella yunxiaonensis]
MLNHSQMQQLQAIAIAAGNAIMSVYRTQDFNVELKADQTPVTQADLLSHQVINRNLQRYFPQWPVLSEESVVAWEQRKEWQQFWLVDPLDGTKEFIKRNGEFTVNIALIDKGEAVAGVVYVPVTGECYCGCKGLGSWKIIKDQVSSLTASAPSRRNTPVIVSSRSHVTPGLQDFLATLQNFELLEVGSSLKLCLLAEGRADLYPRLGDTSWWDIAAGQAVLEHAGGKLLRYDGGEPLRYNQTAQLTNPWFIACSADWLLDSEVMSGETE